MKRVAFDGTVIRDGVDELHEYVVRDLVAQLRGLPQGVTVSAALAVEDDTEVTEAEFYALGEELLLYELAELIDREERPFGAPGSAGEL